MAVPGEVDPVDPGRDKKLICIMNCIMLLCAVAQSCLTTCNSMGCSLPGSSLHGVLQARILEWRSRAEGAPSCGGKGSGLTGAGPLAARELPAGPAVGPQVPRPPGVVSPP